MTDAMDDEFDTVAAWTADAALALGPQYVEPAACRGSGGPRTLDALLNRLELTPGDRLLDVGAGVGGPSRYAARTRDVRPTLVEPARGACRAAQRLFGFPVVRGGATELPFADDSFDAVWSLGVVCTVADQPAMLAELHRVVRPGGMIGLLVFEAQGTLPEQPDGNTFPSAATLTADLVGAGLEVHWRGEMTPSGDEDPVWQQRSDEVHDELRRRHRDDEAWRTAEEQSGIIGRLLADGHLVGRLLIVRG